MEKKNIPSLLMIGFEEEQTFQNIVCNNLKLKKKDDNERHIFEVDHLSAINLSSITTVE